MNITNILQVRTEESEMEFEDEVDLLMSGDIISAQISTKPISFTKAQSGWIFKEDRKRKQDFMRTKALSSMVPF